jgi:hypothetical protein
MSDQEQGPVQGDPGGGEMRLPTVPEVVLSSAQLLVSLAADAIARRERLEEAQLAIDTLDALLPVLGRVVRPEELRAFRGAISELQMAFVQAQQPAAEGEQEQPATQEGPGIETPPRAKIWTPGGDV